MREVRVYGGLAPPRDRRDTDIVLDPAVPQGSPGYVNIRLHDLTRKMVSNLPPRQVDLLEVASYVYAADQLVRRDTLKMSQLGADWRRSFQFNVAVRDTAFWARSDVQAHLISTLEFLSDDNVGFKFVKLKPRPATQAYFAYETEGPTSGFEPDEVMLFSGGLDSFAGALDALLGNQKRVALVSHCASPMVTGVQRRLVTALRERAGHDRLLHLSVQITRGHEKAVEFTQRSRSFLFAVLGFLVAQLFDRRHVSFYENGVVSLNLPLASHVVGTRATRTTHPRVLHDLGTLFSLVGGQDVRVGNPFFWKTKADVVQRIADLGYGDLIPSTFSCASVREATKLRGRHCGVCSQCLDRRFGVLAAECGRYEPAEIYDTDLFRGEREPGADTIMAEAYVLSAHQHAKSSETSFVGSYIEVLRAAPYLGGIPHTEAVARLHRLHQRHGRAVTGVVEQAISSVGTLVDHLTLPNDSLMAMIMGARAQDIVCHDALEREPPAGVQAEQWPLPITPRPISFSSSAERVIFADRVVLQGRPAQLIHAMLSKFTTAEFIPAEQIATGLGIGDVALRQLISRTRDLLSTRFDDAFGLKIESDEIIQNRRWDGYRLNPYLAFTPRQNDAKQPDVHAAE